jgi:hypothetical protein
VPEHQARRLFLQVEQVQLLAQLAVVALFGLFQHVQVGSWSSFLAQAVP